MTDDGTVDIAGLPKGAVLAVLYNAAAPHGLGFLQTEHAPELMTTLEAQAVIDGRGHDHHAAVRRFLPFYATPVLAFTYVYGRPLKADLNGDRFSPGGYDGHHGTGAAAFAVAELRRTGDVCPDTVYAVHVRRLCEEASDVLADPDAVAAFERNAGMGNHAARLTALARKALGASA